MAVSSSSNVMQGVTSAGAKKQILVDSSGKLVSTF
jgi:hypothetical protein